MGGWVGRSACASETTRPVLRRRHWSHRGCRLSPISIPAARWLSKLPRPDTGEQQLALNFAVDDLGPIAGPVIVASSTELAITLNENAANKTTAQDLVNAIAADPVASQLFVGTVISGDGDFAIVDTIDPFARLRLIGLGSTFRTATDIDVLGNGIDSSSFIFSSEIDPRFDASVVFPGSNEDPGHRELNAIVPERHINPEFGSDPHPGITTIEYGFPAFMPFDFDHPLGITFDDPAFNFITENQKQRAREAFEIWGDKIGVQFVEVDRGVKASETDFNELDTNQDGVFPTFPTLTSSSSAPVRLGDGPGGLVSQFLPDPSLESGFLILDVAEPWDDLFGHRSEKGRARRSSRRAESRLLHRSHGRHRHVGGL